MKILVPIILVCIILFASCNKEVEQIPSENEISKLDEISVVDGRLTFQSLDHFSQLVDEYHNGKKVNPQARAKYAKVRSLNYVSLLDQNKKALIGENTVLRTNETDNDSIDFELVPDELFASLLNDKSEIAVGGVIYKVTQFGTFMLPADRINILYDLLHQEDPNINYFTDLSSHKFFEKKASEEGLYDLGNDIYLYDTFGKKDKEKVVFTSVPVENEYSISRKSADPYGDLRVFNYGNCSFFGPVIQGIFGRNELHYRTWDSKRRSRTNFYDTNYLVYAALGFSCKFQKKNWIGWSLTNCQEIRCGVLALKFQAWSITPQRRPIQTGTPKLINNAPPPTVSLNNDPFIHVDLLGCYDFTVSEKTAAQYAVKSCYDYLKRKLGPNTPPEKNLTYTCWVNTQQTKARYYGGKNERITYNNSQQSEVFAAKTGVLNLTWTVGDGWMPAVGGSFATSIGLEEADVYATCKYANNWQGIHIVLKK